MPQSPAFFGLARVLMSLLQLLPVLKFSLIWPPGTLAGCCVVFFSFFFGGGWWGAPPPFLSQTSPRGTMIFFCYKSVSRVAVCQKQTTTVPQPPLTPQFPVASFGRPWFGCNPVFVFGPPQWVGRLAAFSPPPQPPRPPPPPTTFLACNGP